MKEIQISILVLSIVGFIFALLLAFLSRKLRVEEDPRVEKVMMSLPGLNCGACGFSGCRPFAEAVVKERSIFSGCLPGGEEVNKNITSLLGLAGHVGGERRVVFCRCGAENKDKKGRCYIGPNTCRISDIIGGNIVCRYGCLGYGDCLEVCPKEAISLKEGRVYVDIERCIGCGKCIEICPRNLFEFVSLNKDLKLYYIACNNKDKAVNVRELCSKGCIACGICVKVDNSPYYLTENLSHIDRVKVNNEKPLEQARIKCPTKCILIQE